MAYRRFLRKSLMLTAKTMQNIWNFIVGKSSLQEMATSAIILEISDSNLESGRYGPKSGVSGIIRESWQPYFCLRPWNMAVNSVVAASFFSKYKYKMRKVAISSLLSYAADLPLICSCRWARTNCDTVPPTHKNILSHQQNHHGLMPIYIYLQSWPSVNFTGILAFNAGVASIGDDFCSDVDTVSQALLPAML